jgi:hypothetical protein|tara:strand:- start:430 stop:681 length:252 start_codon:yes stop_codon:yes gene_type:complete
MTELHERIATLEANQVNIQKNTGAIWDEIKEHRKDQSAQHVELMTAMEGVKTRVNIHGYVLKGLAGLSAIAGGVFGYFKSGGT